MAINPSKTRIGLMIAQSVLVLFCAVCAYANSPEKLDLYVTGEVGLSTQANRLKNDDNYFHQRLKDSPVYGVGLGYYMNNNLRTELSINYRPGLKFSLSNPDDMTTQFKQNIKSLNAMLSVYYDFGPYKNLKPYIGAGLGTAVNTAGNLVETEGNGNVMTTYGKRTNNFAYQISTGCYMKLSDSYSLNMGYRFVDLGKFETSNRYLVRGQGQNDTYTITPLKNSLQTHEFFLGLKLDL